MKKKISKREARHIIHIPKSDTNPDDVHYVKELITFEDGSTINNINLIKDFKRPYFITKPYYRNHKQKKECEHLDKLNKYYSTESDLNSEIAKHLGIKLPAKRITYRDVLESPYVYGTDTNSCAILKHIYLTKYPDASSENTVATLDIEVDIDKDTIIIISIAMYDKIYVAIDKHFLDNKYKNKETSKEELIKLYKEYIPKTDITNNMDIEIDFLNNEMELVLKTLQKLHTWEPDFVLIWNITYDIEKILHVIEKNKIDPKDLFSDPNIPKEYRYFKYKKGNTSKTTASGVHKPKDFEEQWHTIYCPSSFYWLDAMSLYKYIRISDKAVPSGYSLDSVLDYELGKEYKKLKFRNIDEDLLIDGVEWHKHMVKNHPLEYIIYNMWDVISMLHLEKKTADASMSIGVLSGISSYDIFNSGPKRIVNAMYFLYIENNKVLGTRDAFSDAKETLGLGDWIVLLTPDELNKEASSNRCIMENENLETSVFKSIYDLDQSAGYPNNTIINNVSLETTLEELVSIENIPLETLKKQNIDLLFGNVNSIDYCCTMLNFPTLEELLE